MKDDRYGYGFWPYIVPYAAFVLLSLIPGWLRRRYATDRLADRSTE